MTDNYNSILEAIKARASEAPSETASNQVSHSDIIDAIKVRAKENGGSFIDSQGALQAGPDLEAATESARGRPQTVLAAALAGSASILDTLRDTVNLPGNLINKATAAGRLGNLGILNQASVSDVVSKMAGPFGQLLAAPLSSLEKRAQGKDGTLLGGVKEAFPDNNTATSIAGNMAPYAFGANASLKGASALAGLVSGSKEAAKSDSSLSGTLLDAGITAAETAAGYKLAGEAGKGLSALFSSKKPAVDIADKAGDKLLESIGYSKPGINKEIQQLAKDRVYKDSRDVRDYVDGLYENVKNTKVDLSNPDVVNQINQIDNGLSNLSKPVFDKALEDAKAAATKSGDSPEASLGSLKVYDLLKKELDARINVKDISPNLKSELNDAKNRVIDTIQSISPDYKYARTLAQDNIVSKEELLNTQLGKATDKVQSDESAVKSIFAEKSDTAFQDTIDYIKKSNPQLIPKLVSKYLNDVTESFKTSAPGTNPLQVIQAALPNPKIAQRVLNSLDSNPIAQAKLEALYKLWGQMDDMNPANSTFLSRATRRSDMINIAFGNPSVQFLKKSISFLNDNSMNKEFLDIVKSTADKDMIVNKTIDLINKGPKSSGSPTKAIPAYITGNALSQIHIYKDKKDK